MAKTKYFVTDKNGRVHTRSSDRVYTHCVVRHWDAYDYQVIDWDATHAAAKAAGRPKCDWRDGYLAREEDYVNVTKHADAGSTDFGWCGRPDLAQAQARQAWKRDHTVDVEILEAKTR